MIETLSGLLGSIRQTSPVIFSGLALASGIVLFSGEPFVAAIGLEEFRNIYKPYIGACFILSSCLVVAQIAKHSIGVAMEMAKKWKGERDRKLLLKTKQIELSKLTPDEKAYLAPYILEEKTTQYFLMEDGIKGSLETKGIIYRASNMGDMVEGWAYNIQPWAKEYLENNKNLLEGMTINIKKKNSW